MRTFLSGLSALLCGFLLIGAMGAPILPSQSYYINDHAGVIEQENRDEMLERAQGLYESTGVRVVLLTVEDLDGRTPEEYAELIFRSWEIDAGGMGILILLSTEEKRFVTWSNADLPFLDSIGAADQLTDAEKFDQAATNCFMSIVDSIYSKHSENGEIMPKASQSGAVESEASVIDKQASQITQNTKDTPSTQVTESATPLMWQRDVFFGFLFIILAFFFMRMGKKGSKSYQKASQEAEYYIRKIYSPDEPIAVRTDDVDYPSGFGGLGNRKAIYLEDVDAADDIGIIKRKKSDYSDTAESNGNGR